jgi:hypothetical protein
MSIVKIIWQISEMEIEMPNLYFGRALSTGLLLAAIAFPSAAFANDNDRANAAITTAQAKIGTGDSLGATDQAADIQARARMALQTAQLHHKKHNDEQATHAANHATALAELAIATAELKTLTTQRDQLAAR